MVGDCLLIGTDMSLDPNQLHAKLIQYGDDWADKQSAYDQLEGAKSSVLAKLMMASNAPSVAAREMEAKASPEYEEYRLAVEKAQAAAIKAKVQYEAIKVWIELKRTEAANQRAEMRLT